MVRPMRHARARAAGSGELPRLAKNRLAVPEGKTQTIARWRRRA